MLNNKCCFDSISTDIAIDPQLSVFTTSCNQVLVIIKGRISK